jgi:two-component sensor histidine kinase
LKPGTAKQDIDSAFLLTDQADSLARQIGFVRGREIAAFERSRINVEIGDTLTVNRLFPLLSDSNKAKVMLERGMHCIYDNKSRWKGSIHHFCQVARRMSSSNADATVKCFTEELLALADLAFGKLQTGRSYARRSFHFFDSTGDAIAAGQLCDRVRLLSGDYPFDSLAEFSIDYPVKMLLREGGYEKVIEIYINYEYFESSNRASTQAIAIGKKTLELANQYHDTSLFRLYFPLMNSYFRNGDLYHCLFYGHKALEYVRLGRSPDEAYYHLYYQLAEASLQLGRLEQAIGFCQQGLSDIKRCMALPGRSAQLFSDATDYRTGLYRQQALGLCRQGRAAQGFALLQEYESEHPEKEAWRSILQLAKGECCWYLKRYAEAERYFSESLSVASPDESLRVMLPLARLLIFKGEIASARDCLEKLLHGKSWIVSPFRLREAYFLLYQTDSIRGDFKSASFHLRQYETLNDSLFSVSRDGQLETQQLQFATAERDRDIKSQVQQIQLLKKGEELQEARVRTAHLLRNMVIVCSLFLILLLAVVYNRYRLKRDNAALLLSVIAEKEELLVQKEWLIKEVHHRVKNNMQIVISLLDMASRYIGDEMAAAVMRDSQHRMYAMSLIHEKLYGTEGTQSVAMEEYIRDLVFYLDANFNLNRKIRFRLELHPTSLPATLAVPVGLFLNEAITNSIKHAFPAESGGIISVLMSEEQSAVILAVSDNGIGLSPDFEKRKSGSMGINLMRALVRQIHGVFDIEGKDGVTVRVRFQLGQRVV